MEAGFEAANGPEIEWKEIEEEGTVSFGGKRDHLALLLLVGLIEDILQIGRLAAETGAIVDDLAIDLASREVDETQTFASLGRRATQIAWYRRGELPM